MDVMIELGDDGSVNDSRLVETGWAEETLLVSETIGWSNEVLARGVP